MTYDTGHVISMGHMSALGSRHKTYDIGHVTGHYTVIHIVYRSYVIYDI